MQKRADLIAVFLFTGLSAIIAHGAEPDYTAHEFLYFYSEGKALIADDYSCKLIGAGNLACEINSVVTTRIAGDPKTCLITLLKSNDEFSLQPDGSWESKAIHRCNFVQINHLLKVPYDGEGPDLAWRLESTTAHFGDPPPNDGSIERYCPESLKNERKTLIYDMKGRNVSGFKMGCDYLNVIP